MVQPNPPIHVSQFQQTALHVIWAEVVLVSYQWVRLHLVGNEVVSNVT